MLLGAFLYSLIDDVDSVAGSRNGIVAGVIIIFGGLTSVFGLLGVLVGGDASMYNKNAVAYTMYRAYDDGRFTEDELDAFRQYGEISEEDVSVVLDEMQPDGEDLVKEVSPEVMRDYEVLVNGAIERADYTKDKLDFKRYVLEQEDEQRVLYRLWVDKKLDDRERELVEYLGDVTYRNTDGVISDLEAGEYDRAVEELGILYNSVSNVSTKFKLGDIAVDGSEDEFFKLD